MRMDNNKIVMFIIIFIVCSLEIQLSVAAYNYLHQAGATGQSSSDVGVMLTEMFIKHKVSNLIHSKPWNSFAATAKRCAAAVVVGPERLSSAFVNHQAGRRARQQLRGA